MSPSQTPEERRLTKILHKIEKLVDEAIYRYPHQP